MHCDICCRGKCRPSPCWYVKSSHERALHVFPIMFPLCCFVVMPAELLLYREMQNDHACTLDDKIK